MSYIGKTPTVGNFQVCDAISVVNNQAAYTMQVGSVNVSPESANHMIVSLNGVIQKPNSSYTVAGAVITFSSALVTGDVINFIQILGSVLDLGVPSDDTVSTVKLQNDSVTTDKLANSINSAITANTAKTGITSSQASAIIANTAKVTNATHSGEVTGATALTIANNIVDEANLKVSNSPTNGYVLSAQSGNTGGLTWAEAGGGDFVKLATTTLGSNATTITFSASLITTTYDNYFITGFIKPVTNNTFLRARLLTSENIQTGTNYMYAVSSLNGSDHGTSNGHAYFNLLRGGSGNDTGEGVSFNMWLQNPMVSSIPTTLTANLNRRDESGNFLAESSAGYYPVLEANNGILFYFSSGDVVSGSTLSLYGITK